MKDFHLTETELRKFERNGWIGPFDNLLTPAELAHCRDKCQSIVSDKPNHPIYRRHSVRDWHLLDGTIEKLLNNASVVHRLVSLLGEDLQLWRSKIFCTPPKAGGVGWHQEWGYFNGEELGNDIPALKPEGYDSIWDLTIWIALDDITPELSPLQFFSQSQNIRFPIKMVPITESAFYEDPFVRIADKETLVRKVETSKLLLDIKTTGLLEWVDHAKMTFEELKAECIRRLNRYEAAITLPFDTDENVETVHMKKGQFVIFSERTMHRSLPNLTDKSRFALSYRVTPVTTEVYPGRHLGSFLDGSNLDISNHRCILLDGMEGNPKNNYGSARELVAR